jgi:hypothetical protein
MHLITHARIPHLLFIILSSCGYLLLAPGCAQVGAPTGGPKDTIPPRLLSTLPPERSTNFTGNRIVLEFNEYVELKDLQKNLQVSPYPKNNPTVSNKLKTITVKLKDSLLPNTTYAIHFGEAIGDLNEGNPFRDYTYVFSTGSTIDSLELAGKVVLAETGATDSTLLVLLHRNATDSSIQKKRPDFITGVKGDGSFRLGYLPSGKYRVYALKDNDGSKTYNAPTELFGFLSEEIELTSKNPPLNMLAYAAEKEKEKPATVAAPAKQPNVLTYTSSLSLKTLALQGDLELYFNRPLVQPDLNALMLTDTAGNRLAGCRILPDSSGKTLRLQHNWLPGTPYRLIIPQNALRDSAGKTLLKTDTLAFKTKSKTDYGKLTARFKNFNQSLNPVVQFWQAEKMVRQQAVKTAVWTEELFEPGEYGIRILYDENNNGRWDPGDYNQKRQPEKVVATGKRINVKAEWDNEVEIEL